MQHVIHPGPVRPSRMDLAACDGQAIEVSLPAGMPLEDAVAKALAPHHFDSAWLEIKDAPVAPLHYVIPAEATDGLHVAWYSDTYRFETGTIDHLGMIVGRHAGVSFLHGHGTWTADAGTQRMGHILAVDTVLAKPATARGIGLRGARFVRRADAETRFDLFQVEGTDDGVGGFAALRLLPNQDLCNGIDQACKALGWDGARVHGLGSVNRAQFEDGRQLDSLPTEFLILDAIAGDGARGPEIVIVGTDETQILTGRLSRGENAVLVTAELVLSRLHD